MANEVKKAPEAATAVVKPPERIRALLDRARPEIAKALGKHIDPERWLRIAATMVLKSELLSQCDPISILSAVMEAAQLGLELDGVLGHAYLVPFRVRGRLQAQMIPGYKGYIQLAHRSGKISYISAHVVYEKDRFRFQFGTSPVLDHVPSELPLAERGVVRYVYVVVKMADGAVDFDVMTVEEIETVRRTSKAADSGPWVEHWNAMAMKTVIRRKSKFLPLSTQFQRAAVLDEYADAGIFPGMGSGVDVEVTRLATDAKREDLRERYTPPAQKAPKGLKAPAGGEREMTPAELEAADQADARQAAEGVEPGSDG